MLRASVLFVLISSSAALGNAPVQRTFLTLPSSNGHTAVMADFKTGKLVHFREHLFATEEPLLDASGTEVWNGNQPQVIRSRDLLYDAYFGLRSGGTQRWLDSVPVELDRSGYLPWNDGRIGGTGIVHWTQKVGSVEVTTFAFAPRALPRAGFVLALRVRNTGTAPETGVSAFSLHNFHLGFGRPGVMQDIGETGETVERASANGRVDLIERAFAGVIVTRSIGEPSHTAAWSFASPASQNGYIAVQNGGTANLPDASATLPTGDGWVHAFQFDLGDLAPNEEKWAAIAVAHHGDPFAKGTVQSALDAYVNGRTAQQLVEAERSAWAMFQQSLDIPTGASTEEEHLVRQSAVMMAMAQVQESQTFLREHLTTDGELRRTRFSAPGGGAAQLPGVIDHRGKGAVLASLPPGEWTYAWARDGAYAVAAMAELGMAQEAKDALTFFLGAEAGRFQNWNELNGYGMPPYQITLTRYHGFGVEETDFNEFGPNLEFDGFGLVLWALRRYELTTGDTAFAENAWPTISSKVADPLTALIDPTTGLLRKDSSIWETHWNGRERSWTYTNLTAARGLCDAAEIAARVGDTKRAVNYRNTAKALRAAMARWLTDSKGALASNLEERLSGRGYLDAAVLDALAFGLFDPNGRIAHATLDALDANLRTTAGSGWMRNDDRSDHAGAEDLSPWGSEYDSAEWVITNLRGAIAMRRAGRPGRSDELIDWTLRQSQANYLAVSETYEETTGAWKFNAPMIGFGAGAFALALADRAGVDQDPACGAYHVESMADGGTDAGVSGGGDPFPDGGSDQTLPPAGCGCGTSSSALGIAALSVFLAAALRRRRTA